MQSRPSIGIIGAGPVATGLSTLLSRAGYPVTIGTGHPAKPALARLAEAVVVASFVTAAEADVVVLAVRHGAARSILLDVGERLRSKLVIDTMNAWIAEDIAAAGLAGRTEGQWLSAQLPDSQVARAYSHIDWDLLVPRATREPGKWGAGYACDDAQAERVVTQIVRDSGYVPVRVGTLAESTQLDVGGIFFGRLLPAAHMRELIATPAAL